MIKVPFGCALLLLLTGCSGMERSEKEKLRRRNATGEYVYRNSDDYFYPIGVPAHTPRAPYPWESEANLPRITKEFFRCKGSPANPPSGETSDCEGSTRHGLPVLRGKEGIYPILTELLNYIQKKTGKRVIVTCGHRCPVHNTYADASVENRTSKHQIGAEVDFYVQGMEDHPNEVVGLIMQYYKETPLYQKDKDFLEFKRSEKSNAGVTVQPWFNKEIFIQLHQKGEGRDLDNRHPHPYITLQVRYDRDSKEKVQYDWNRANKGYAHG